MNDKVNIQDDECINISFAVSSLENISMQILKTFYGRQIFGRQIFLTGKKIPQSNMSEKQIIIFWSEQTSCNLGMLQVNLPPPLPFNFSNGQ